MLVFTVTPDYEVAVDGDVVERENVAMMLRYLVQQLLEQAGIYWCEWHKLPERDHSDEEIDALWEKMPNACPPWNPVRNCLQVLSIETGHKQAMRITFRSCAYPEPVTVVVGHVVARVSDEETEPTDDYQN
jgi:hypothetical protein